VQERARAEHGMTGQPQLLLGHSTNWLTKRTVAVSAERWSVNVCQAAVGTGHLRRGGRSAVAIRSGERAMIRVMSTGFREQLSIEAGGADEGEASGAREPQRLLLDAIAAGELDSHLTAIADAVGARRYLLHTVRSATALAELCIGDVVRINHTVRPQYLHGACATIVAIDDRTATVQLERSVGRFRSGQVRCPALALDRVPRGA
jgi:hypothetical protein